jgi:hypothetical protein
MPTRKPLTTERKVELYNRQGWCPVPWRHHAPEIRELIHMLGFRPQMKCCYMNSQRFVVGNYHKGAGLDLEYREGWAIGCIVPVQHAWLLYKGEVLDLTLDSSKTQYLQSCAVDVEEVLEHMIKTRVYGPVLTEEQYQQISPWRDASRDLEILNRLLAEKFRA